LKNYFYNWQFCPKNGDLQAHEYELAPKGVHVPPFKHGLIKHGFIISQKFPI